MAYISKLTIGGVTYDIYDAEVREMVSKVLVFAGVTTATITDGGSTPSTYGGLTGIPTPYPIDPATGQPHLSTDTLDSGTVVIDGGKEFVWDGTKWVEFGDLSDLSLSPTWGNYVTSVTATPTNSATNTGAGTAHSHAIPRDSITNLLNGQFMSVVQTTSGVWEPDTNNAITTVNPKKNQLVTDTVTNWTAATAKNVASAGTAVAVFNSIDSTAAGGIKIITDVSGGGTAGSVTTAGVAANLQTTVVTGLATSNATATGRIAYVAGVTSTNKLVTLQTTPASVGTAFSYINGFSTGASLTETRIPYVGEWHNYTSQTLAKATQTVSANSDGTDTYTLTIASEVALGYIQSGAGWGISQAIIPTFTTSYLTFASATPAVAGSLITYATGALAANGSGSAVATGGTTSYLYANTGSQTTNTPTAVSFNTITLTGTPSYIHTTNIVPAVANGTIIGLNTSSTKTFATGSLAANGSGSSVVYDIETSEMAFIDYDYTSLTFPVFSLSTNGSDGIPYINGTKSSTVYTASESAHTHSYSKTTAISVSAPTASALASVTLVPAS